MTASCFPESIGGELVCELPATGASWTPLLFGFGVLLFVAGCAVAWLSSDGIRR